MLAKQLMANESLAAWQTLFAERLGLRFDGQLSLLNTALTRLSVQSGKTAQQLLSLLQQEPLSSELWQLAMDLLVVSTSRFFRDPEMFQAIESWLTSFLMTQPNACEVLSFGSADGSEAYSLAMLFDDTIKTSPVAWQVCGLDISSQSLARAREAIYNERQLQGIPPHYVSHYFEPVDDVCWRPNAVLRSRVSFKHCLLDDRANTLRPHLICCQNTLMYMTQQQQKAYLDGFEKHLQAGGMLLLSPVDAPWWRPSTLRHLKNNKIRAFIKPWDQE